MKKIQFSQFYQILKTKMKKIKEMKVMKEIQFSQFYQISKRKMATKMKEMEDIKACNKEDIKYCMSEEIQSFFYNFYVPIKSSFTKFNILLKKKFNTV